MFKEKNFSPEDYEFYVIDFDAKNAVEEVYQMTKDTFPNHDVTKSIISINVCAHCGPGTVGIVYSSNKK